MYALVRAQNSQRWDDKISCSTTSKCITRIMLLNQIAYRNKVFLKDALPNVCRLNEDQRVFVYTDSVLDFGMYDVVTKKISSID